MTPDEQLLTAGTLRALGVLIPRAIPDDVAVRTSQRQSLDGDLMLAIDVFVTGYVGAVTWTLRIA